LRDQLGTGSYDPRLEHDLHSTAGELAEVVGWLAYDAEAHDLCRRMNQESLYFTRLAGDKTIELLTLQNSSMHAAAEGRPREALHIARSVLEGNCKLSPRVKSLFLVRKARALAQSHPARTRSPVGFPAVGASLAPHPGPPRRGPDPRCLCACRDEDRVDPG
jgi:hypothetical protein